MPELFAGPPEKRWRGRGRRTFPWRTRRRGEYGTSQPPGWFSEGACGSQSLPLAALLRGFSVVSPPCVWSCQSLTFIPETQCLCLTYQKYHRVQNEAGSVPEAYRLHPLPLPAAPFTWMQVPEGLSPDAGRRALVASLQQSIDSCLRRKFSSISSIMRET